MNAEKNVIGAIMLDQDSINQIDLTPDMFNDSFLGRIYLEYRKATDMSEKLVLADLVNRFDDIGISNQEIIGTLKTILIEVQTSATIKEHARVVKDTYKAREFSSVINSIIPTPFGVDGQIAQMIGDLEIIIDKKDDRCKSLKKVVEQNKDNYFVEKEERPLTGIECIDNRLLWLEKGDITVIAARPSVGKSALVLQIAENISKQGFKCALYNLEMMESQIYERFIARASGMNLQRIKKANAFLNDEKEKYQKAVSEVSELDIDIMTGSRTVSKIKSECRNMEYDVIIIDYLQLMSSDIKTYNRSEMIGQISTAMKMLATDLKTHVILLSQLNRSSEYTPTKEPDMSNLRDSGQVEQDASNIIMLWNLDDERIYKGCKVDKARQGKVGRDVLEFDGGTMNFIKCDKSIKDIQQDSGFKKTNKEWDEV